MFRSGTTIYVHSESLEDYKSNGYWNDYYNILPLETMSANLGLELEILGNIVYTGSDRFATPARIRLTGDLSKLKDIDSFGYYIGSELYPLSDINSTTETTLYYNDDYFTMDYSAFVATAKISAGSYIKFTDGNIARYDNRELELTYDQKPSVTFVSIDASSFTVNVTGGYWIYDFEEQIQGNCYFSGSITRIDGEHSHSYSFTAEDYQDVYVYYSYRLRGATATDYDHNTTNSLHFRKNSDGSILREVVFNTDNDLSGYSVRFSALEQTWSGYENDSEGIYYFTHGLKLGITADEELMAESQEIGIYLTADNQEYTHPMTSVQMDTVGISFSKDKYSLDWSNQYAAKNVNFGTYAILKNGQKLKFNETPLTLYYDKKPSATFLSAKSEFLGAEKKMVYDYTYDDNGTAIDSVLVEKTLCSYADTLRFKIEGAVWMKDYTYYVYDYGEAGENYSGLGLPGDSNFRWAPGRSRYLENPAWEAEYFLFENNASYDVSTNYLKRTWNADNTCTMEIVEGKHENPYVSSSAAIKAPAGWSVMRPKEADIIRKTDRVVIKNDVPSYNARTFRLSDNSSLRD